MFFTLFQDQGNQPAIKRETLLTLSEGVATPKEIDAIFKDVLKTPKGLKMASISLGVATPSDNVRRVSRLIAAQILEYC
jgi:3-hydroxyacyl-CoA dehydrogenase